MVNFLPDCKHGVTKLFFFTIQQNFQLMMQPKAALRDSLNFISSPGWGSATISFLVRGRHHSSTLGTQQPIEVLIALWPAYCHLHTHKIPLSTLIA